jgi:hypothetical protein
MLAGGIEGGINGGASGGIDYMTSGQRLTAAGFTQAVAGGAASGVVMGSAGGALAHVSGVARYGCFTAGTPVLMADGTMKPIDQVGEGEEVASYDPATGVLRPAVVERTFVHEKVPTLMVSTDGGVVETTGTHPFYVEGRGYTPASELHSGDRLRDEQGRAVRVESIQATGQSRTVYNLQVAGSHNYYVSTTEGTTLLVHNNASADGSCGPVVFKAPANATPEEIAQTKAYVDGCNDALVDGALSSTGRVSTSGELRRAASAAARAERLRRPEAYEGLHVGHSPDTTWTGTAEPHSWLPLTARVNTSLGGQSRGYPIGYQPTSFEYGGVRDLD